MKKGCLKTIAEARETLLQSQCYKGFTVRAVFDNIISNRKVFHSLLRIASLSQKPFQSGDLIRHLPYMSFLIS
ncbi:hypothetical protein SPSIL_017950 [Sporomusa silvacetica DSM 10669]|uniref:Uncharacterized protein n=1 Tax=Sporomusa silvacetica DSM 10669 TaxID=1123289 RepID=A0ABZ3IJ75_9FIRM|nr:hypothetical protein [Sporomusa silvacetica]OZC18448.1 hypothetical protein SPSIL_26480 [Sporomusa silvacetica DSM 10669]